MTAEFEQNAALTLSEQALHFQVFDIGDVSVAQTIQITSTSNTDLVLGTLSLDGADFGEFVLVANNCNGQVLSQSQPCSVEIEFAPGTVGITSASAVLTVPSNAPDSPAAVTLNGALDLVYQDRFE